MWARGKTSWFMFSTGAVSCIHYVSTEEIVRVGILQEADISFMDMMFRKLTMPPTTPPLPSTAPPPLPTPRGGKKKEKKKKRRFGYKFPNYIMMLQDMALW